MRLPISPEASALHDAIAAHLRTISSAMAAGFTTPGGLHQGLAAITKMQDDLPALRRELRAIRSRIRRVA